MGSCPGILVKRRFFDFVQGRLVRKGAYSLLPLARLAFRAAPQNHPVRRKLAATALICANHYLYDDRLPSRQVLADLPVLCREAGYRSERSEPLVARRTIVLKKPVEGLGSVVEKGVVLLKYTNIFGFFLERVDVEALMRLYHVVLEPSWSGFCDPNILGWTRYASHKVLVHASEPKDFRFLKELDSNLVPIEAGACDYVDHRVFRPLSGMEKRFDAVYVAVFGVYKRHHVLFRAMKAMGDPTYRVALVGRDWEGSRAEVEALIRHYGLERQVEIFEDLDHVRVNEVLNQSKTNVLLSLREGSNKSIFEGFFADVPGVILEGNIGVNKHYLNESTGLAAREAELPRVLAEMRERWRSFSPREWAMAHIAPERTAERLNRTLRDLALAGGEEWSVDIQTKVNSPELAYFDPEAACGLPSGLELIDRFRLAEADQAAVVA